MMDTILTLLILAVVIAAVGLRLVKRIGRSGGPLNIDGKLIWVDEGQSTKPFFNHLYRILGKPDFMYKIKGGVLAVEYKSRKSGVYESDIVQAKCAALAARGNGYRVIKIMVKADSDSKVISLPGDNQILYNEIKRYIDICRDTKAGKTAPALPSRRKCRSCAYRYTCNHGL
jgi:CRISPR/Cas system-associated exonuclease Cas4 (RecB family)